MNVEIPSWELIGELNRRIEAGEIYSDQTKEGEDELIHEERE